MMPDVIWANTNATTIVIAELDSGWIAGFRLDQIRKITRKIGESFDKLRASGYDFSKAWLILNTKLILKRVNQCPPTLRPASRVTPHKEK